MATITAAMVKDLREKSGAGMMDCKAALKETDGDMEAAIDWLRAKGIAKSDKKAGRVAADGLVGIVAEGTKGVVVEVNSETDFVAKNATFQEMVQTISKVALEANGDVDALKSAEYPGAGKSVEEQIKEMVGTIGENMTLRRTAALSVDKGVVASYMHNAAGDGIGKIGVLVALESEGDAEKLADFGKKVGMHVAAMNPAALDKDSLDPAVVEREKAVLTEQAKESGKPDNVIEKMIGGRMQKFFKESCLVSQVFVIDGENTVEKAAEIAAKDAGSPIKIAGFVRFELGDGIEKKEEDFAAEVAATAAGN